MLHRLTTWADAHPIRAAVVLGLAAGLLALVIGWLPFQRPSWNPAVLATLIAGSTTYFQARTRPQRERLRRRNSQTKEGS